eukprot:GHVT01073562.1.p1 GENE.GHVT01073562.1~~GHVT01073562.1.p1  ORF type:complete len:208 (-),score=36.65 GHVT01073562.1:1108-1731(-)
MTDAFTTLSPVCVIPSPSRSSSPSSASIAISSSSSSSPSACGVSSGYNSSGVAGDYRVLSACDTSSPFPRARPDVVTARQDAVQQLHSSLQRLRARGWLHLTKEVEEVANAFTKSRPMDHLPVNIFLHQLQNFTSNPNLTKQLHAYKFNKPEKKQAREEETSEEGSEKRNLERIARLFPFLGRVAAFALLCGIAGEGSNPRLSPETS